MTTEQIGYRRLYDAAGCSLANQDELEVNGMMGEFEVRVYIGPRPKLGIAFTTVQGKYIIPGEISPVFTTEYKKDATESSYPRKFFTEILCIKKIEVADELSKLFHAKDTNAQNELLALTAKDTIGFRNASNLTAGVIGLRFHPQFILEEINENFFAVRDENDWPFQITGPWMQILEDVSLNPFGTEMLSKHIQAVSQANPATQQFGASALTWLLRAWPERNSIQKFLSLFTPLEMILAGYSGNPEHEKEKQENIKKIQGLILAQDDNESKQLADFFQKISVNLRPSLASRFEQLAGEAKIEGWEADVIAFRRFNSMRNSLLHQGDGKVELSTTISDENVEEETRHLEDIAERYVSWALFRDEVVYQSQWRTQRKIKSSASNSAA
jgi:hypothetical protein